MSRQPVQPLLYVLGGQWAGGGTATVQVYDVIREVVSDTQQATNVPDRRKAHSAVTVKMAGHNYIYVLGGYPNEKTNWRYSVTHNKWEGMADMIQGRCLSVALYVSGSIYVVGGFSGSSVSARLSSVEVYNVREKTWAQGPELPYTLDSAAGCVLDNTLYISRGYKLSGAICSSLLRLDTSGGSNQTVWNKETAQLCIPRACHAMFTHDTRLIVMGGPGCFTLYTGQYRDLQACHSIFNLKVKNKRSQFIKLKVQTSEIKGYFSTICHRNQIESEYCAKLFLEQKEIIQG